jgi:hypothetical protein
MAARRCSRRRAPFLLINQGNPIMDNTSGQGAAAVVPSEIRGWNWGAFMLNWIWGIGNNTLIALLTFVPLVNFVMIFVLGAKGNEWAWRNKRWRDVEHFRQAQRTWGLAGLGVLAFGVLLAVGVFFAVTGLMKSSEAYTQASATVARDDRVRGMFGAPLSFGTPMGNIEVNGPTGSANLSFPVSGPLAEGTVFVEARKQMGNWTILQLAVQPEDSTERIRISSR